MISVAEKFVEVSNELITQKWLIKIFFDLSFINFCCDFIKKDFRNKEDFNLWFRYIYMLSNIFYINKKNLNVN